MIIVLVQCQAFDPVFKSWDYWDGPGFLRFTLRFSDDTSYEIIRMEDKRLFVVDIKGDFKKETHVLSIDKGNVETVRIGSYKPGITRLVIKLKYINEVKVYQANKKKDDQALFFIDVDDYYVAKSDKANLVKEKPFTVVLDPGHGGMDPGAMNAEFGFNEKDITLDVSKKVKWIFDNMKQDKIKVLLTRDTDIFLPLRKRARIAQNLEADIFMSVHADSSYRESATGASFYYHSETSSSVEANWVAYKENKDYFIEESSEVSDISVILKDLKGANSQKNSSILAGIVKDGFVENKIDIHGRGVFCASFTVLESSYCPSSLIEIGFVSNPKESKRLTGNIYRYDLAKSIASAIIKYYEFSKEKTFENKTFPGVEVDEKLANSCDAKLNFYCVNKDYLKPVHKQGGNKSENNN